jgi:hypothetical protein
MVTVSHSERLAELSAQKKKLASAYLSWCDSPEAQTLEGRRALMTIQTEEAVLEDIMDFVRKLERKKKCH